ncbi:MAG: carbohydrate binding domain-containing protein, partial [Pyrinomonadaceae bacterium]
RRALQVVSEAGAGGLAEGQLSNRGFESDIGPAGRALFEWDVVPAAGAQVAVDARTAREGRRSLRVVFNASGQIDFRNVSQVVTVEPGARYRLSFWVKSDGLKSASMPVVFVSEAASPDAPLVASPPAPAGTSDWQQVSLEFAAGPRTEAVVVRLARAACPDGVCPIFGKIWYDDFNLERAGGRPNAGR